MNRKIFRWTYLSLAIIFAIAGLLAERVLFVKYSDRVDAQAFEQTLHQKETIAKDLIQYLAQKLKLHQYTQLNGIIFFDTLNLHNAQKQQIYFLIYEQDTLRFWTDNHADLPYTLSEQLSMQVNKLGNIWYEIISQGFGQYRIFALIKLKEEYPYKNKYLKDQFATGFNLPPSVKISLIPVSYGFDIKSIDGNYVFTLVPEKSFIPFNRPTSNLPLSLYLLAILAIIAFLHQLQYKIKLRSLFLTLAIILVVRVLMIVFRFPAFLYSYPLFQPVIGSYSIGDLLIDATLLLFAILSFANNFSYASLRPEKNTITIDLTIFSISLLILLALFFAAYELFIYVIVHSPHSFEIYRILQLDYVSTVAILTFGLIFMTLLYAYKLLLNVFRKYLRTKRLVLVLVIIFAVLWIINLIVFPQHALGKVWILLGLVLLTVLAMRENLSFTYLMLSIAFISAVIVADIIYNGNNEKFHRLALLLAKKVENLHDPVAEQLLLELEKSLLSDQILQAYLSKPASLHLQTKITHYLYKEYFQGYWKKYELKVTLCSDQLQLPETQQRQICSNRFGQLITKYGKYLSQNISFVSQSDGLVKYIIKLSAPENDLYIELIPKVIPQKSGYPELLLDTPINRQIPKNFSYAKYINNKLSVRYGSFDYPITAQLFAKHVGQTVKIDHYKHLVQPFSEQEDNLIVVSYPTISIIDMLITLSYLFVFCILLELVVILMFGPAAWPEFKSLTIKNKLILSMIGILTIAFLTLGLVTAYFNIKRFKQGFTQEVKQKIHTAAEAIEFNTEKIDTVSNAEFLAKQVKKLSQILDADINLYRTNGLLLISSRPKIFDYKLLSPLINYFALESILVQQKSEFITNEQIGQLKYTSAYAPIIIPQSQIVGYVNIPFFINPDQLHEQISNLIVTLINLYVVLFLLTVALAVLLSEQVIAPLNVLQQKFKKLKLGQKYEKIDYKRDDEIGQLVQEYNRMVDKLEQSIELLTKSERESAWREMAKQIAHEIKNPLTPMKLSIQLLQRAWENKDKNFDKRLKEVTQTLIEQIETLRNIAEEFSAFAKMPVSEKQKIDLAQKIENIVKLFENIENVQVKAIIKHRPVYIWADNKQLSRVFINLIKNAIQAIPEGIDGKVIVELDVKDDKALVKVIDNGTGIPEDVRSKLFTPSFTTKSSGMGLGLAMVKNIILNAQGRIWFETEVGKGTTFYIEFPLYQEQQEQEQQADSDQTE